MFRKTESGRQQSTFVNRVLPLMLDWKMDRSKGRKANVLRPIGKPL